MSEQAKSGACVIKEVCSHLTSGALEDAAQLLRERYPFDLRENAGRKCTLKKAVGILLGMALSIAIQDVLYCFRELCASSLYASLISFHITQTEKRMNVTLLIGN